MHVQQVPLHKSSMQHLDKLQSKLNFLVHPIPDVKQLVTQIPHLCSDSQVWLDVEMLDETHMCEHLKQIHTTLCMLWHMHHATQLRMHVVVNHHMCASQLKSLMTTVSCGWIMRSDLGLRHICARIMQDVTCDTSHVSVSVTKMLQHEPVLTARDKVRMSWFTPAHNRVVRDAWIKQAYSHAHISYNTFETWESFIRSIVMPTFTVDVIVIDDHMLQNMPHMHAYDVVNCVHTLRSHAAPDTPCAIYVAVNPQTMPEKIREWQNTPHVTGITCAFDASYAYAEFESSVNLMIHHTPHVCASVATRLDAGKSPPKKPKSVTLRQKQIWELIVKQGASNKQIAHRLNISEATVKQHVGIMLKKFTLRNRTQLAQIMVS